MPYFDDDGTKRNPDLMSKPSLCIACAEDERDQTVCNLTRLDQQGEARFICYAYRPRFSAEG